MRVGSWWARARERYGWLDHLARAVDRYIEHNGYHYVASIAYFTLLSLIPMLMVTLSVAGFVLADQPGVLNQLLHGITSAVPGPLGTKAGELLQGFIEQRTKVGVLGLAIGLYSGWNWMNALRDALTAMWEQQRPALPFFRTIAKDLLALLSLVVALTVSFSLTASSGTLGTFLLSLAGVDDASWAHTAVSILSIPLALLADWLVFLWVLARLPREPVGIRSAMRGAVAAAIGFELLKLAGGIYLGIVGGTPTGAAFGSVIGLLFFIALVSRLLVFITAWTATGFDAPRKAVAPPGPFVLAPVMRPRRSGPRVLAGAVAGSVLTLVLGRVFRRRRRDE
ncbi:membrane protein [Amycolatopsis xylanica]|uniref:Membrane protein n=1 Tax=Amycolatopsis xylanica TaxID=589385 RepID=A0A1H2UNS6_9PSEU|nr:YhjD/YihY/BrkB family envelope integrity protein [Amycolatopsis xylanica]SDW57194.1 membrane protein [Amycolatopsis xylanica]